MIFDPKYLDHIQAICAIVQAFSAVLGVIAGFWAIGTWRQNLKAEDMMRRRQAARIIALAANELLSEVTLLLNGKPPRAWLRDDRAVPVTWSAYTPIPREIEIRLIDSLIADLLDRIMETRFDRPGNLLKQADPLLKSARKCRDRIAKCAFSEEAAGSRRSASQENTPEGNPSGAIEPLLTELLNAHEMLEKALTPLLTNWYLDEKEFRRFLEANLEQNAENSPRL